MAKEFLAIIHDHQKIVYKVCRVYRDSRKDQEDLFQEIVYQLWKFSAVIMFQLIFLSFRMWNKWIKNLKLQVKDFDLDEES
jgi:DNA-directed RNA polymerase specialized sigma24 family protein